MYKNLGVSNTEIALYTSWLYLPWVIKPLWGPLVDLLGSKRRLDRCAAVDAWPRARWRSPCPWAKFLQMTLAVLWLMAFALGHPRHRRRRLVHAGAAAARSGGIRRRAQHLPAGHDRPAKAGWSTLAGSADRAQWQAGCRPGAACSGCWRRCSLSAGALSRLGLAASGGRRPGTPNRDVLAGLRGRLRGLFPQAAPACACWPFCCCTVSPRLRR